MAKVIVSMLTFAMRLIIVVVIIVLSGMMMTAHRLTLALFAHLRVVDHQGFTPRKVGS